MVRYAGTPMCIMHADMTLTTDVKTGFFHNRPLVGLNRFLLVIKNLLSTDYRGK